MEGSLRDRVEALVDAGMPEEAAFREAVRRLGSYGTAEIEYRKVYLGSLRGGVNCATNSLGGSRC